MSFTPWQSLVLWLQVGVVLVWLIRYLVVSWALGRMDFLGQDSPRFQGDQPPRVTAIIPAKDEESTLEGCLKSVASQSYPNLEVLVVDDRSTDGTPEIARRFARTDPRFRVLTLTELPPGWTGKTHALQVASREARGDWLWFLDADTRHQPDNLAIVLQYALGHDAAMASLLLELRCETFWEKVVQPLAGIVLIQSFPLFLVNNPARALAFANGQYILIRRDVYDAIGGHRAVRDRFVEDIAMAEKVKGVGLPIRVAVARGIGSTRMYSSLGQIIKGWSRILYDALGRSPWRLLGKILDPLLFSQSGHVALIVALVLLIQGGPAPFPMALLGLSLLHHVLSFVVLRKLYVISVPGTKHVAWFPLANLVMNLVLLRAIRQCLTGRVDWRGTSYDTHQG